MLDVIDDHVSTGEIGLTWQARIKLKSISKSPSKHDEYVNLPATAGFVVTTTRGRSF